MAKLHRLSLVFVLIVCLTVYNVKAQSKLYQIIKMVLINDWYCSVRENATK